MIPSARLIRTVAATSALALTSCMLLPFSPADNALPVKPKVIEDRYQLAWQSIKRVAGAECTNSRLCDPHRELFQLGLPTSSTLVIWHKYETTSDGEPIGPAAVEPTLEDAETHVAVTGQFIRLDCEGHPLHGPELPRKSPCFGAERIEYSGLASGTAYKVRFPGHGLDARTAPAPASADAFSFLATSCNNPFAGGDSGKIAIARLNSLDLLDARASGKLRLHGYPARPDLHVGLGDQVYVDGDNARGQNAPLSLFQGSDSVPVFDQADSRPLLRTVYDYHFAMPPWDGALAALPSALTWDDHEVRDGWKSRDSDILGALGSYYEASTQAFWAYQGLRNPTTPAVHTGQSFDVEFDWGARSHFFMPDGRSHRTFPEHLRGAAVTPRHIFSDSQFSSLDDWLAKADGQESGHLFVLGVASALGLGNDSPTPPTSSTADRHRVRRANAAVQSTASGESFTCEDFDWTEWADDIEDTWLCNKSDLGRLMSALYRHFVLERPQDFLLVLSGDVHMSSITALVSGHGQNAKLIGYEVTSSGVANDSVKAGLLEWASPSGARIVADPALRMPDVLGYGMGTIRGAPSFAEIRIAFPQGLNGPSQPRVDVAFLPSSSSRRNGKGALVNRIDDLMLQSEVPVEEFSTNDVRYEASSCESRPDDWNRCPRSPRAVLWETQLAKNMAQVPTGIGHGDFNRRTDPCVPLHQCSIVTFDDQAPSKKASATDWLGNWHVSPAIDR